MTFTEQAITSGEMKSLFKALGHEGIFCLPLTTPSNALEVVMKKLRHEGWSLRDALILLANNLIGVEKPNNNELSVNYIIRLTAQLVGNYQVSPELFSGWSDRFQRL